MKRAAVFTFALAVFLAPSVYYMRFDPGRVLLHDQSATWTIRPIIGSFVFLVIGFREKQRFVWITVMLGAAVDAAQVGALFIWKGVPDYWVFGNLTKMFNMADLALVAVYPMGAVAALILGNRLFNWMTGSRESRTSGKRYTPSKVGGG